jgi:hypothetical protein
VSNALASVYVNNLYKGVRSFATEKFEFICFTNEKLMLDSGIKRRPFEFITKSGVVPRIYMYSEKAGLFGKQVLALDIDIVIVGSLRDIMGYRGKFCARSKFKPGQEYKLDGDVISFSAGPETEKMIYTPFVQDIPRAEKLIKGRERYWYRLVIGDKADRWDTVAPNQIYSYKRHVRGMSKLPSNARIISCHGVPRPHEINAAWRKQYWRHYG